MDLERDGNLIEAGLWSLLGIVTFIHAFRREKKFQCTLLLLGATLVVFGGSDLVESQTGAWWRPWWLLLWKAACVLMLSFFFTRYFRLKKRAGHVRTGS